MKSFSILISLSLIIWAGTLNAQGRTLPDATLKTLDGQNVEIADYTKNGKTTIISFWATWCSPCKKELDAIAEIYPDWQEEYDVDLIAITIDTRRNLAKVPVIVETKGWEYIILSDPAQNLKNALNFQTIPQTYVIDKDGNIVYDHNGYIPGDEIELENKLAELAGK